jgi:phage I-like protein
MNESQAIGVMAADIAGGEGELQLFPAGPFRANDGRPKDADHYVLDETNAAALISAFAAKKFDIVIDYEHQSLLAKENGKPAPAAGWIKTLEWQPGKGLFARCEWTPAAKAAIQAKEYKYISPTFTYRPKTGEITRIFSAALTNTPALDGMEPVIAHASTLLDSEAMETMRTDLEQARSEIARVAALKQAALDELAALKQAAIDEKRRQELEAMDTLIEGYANAGKLLPAEQEAAKKLARLDVEALKTMLDCRVSFFRMQSTDIPFLATPDNKGNPSRLTSEDIRACELTGRDPEEFATLKARYFSEG